MLPVSRSSKWYAATLIALFLLAAGVRALDVWRPVDGTIRDTWREPDVAAMARNFYGESMNILEPRIDWRGDGPGLVEAEFPLYPWLVACLYQLFGYHEELARLVIYFLGMASCYVFYRLASMFLPRMGVLAALCAFAINPMAVRLSTEIKPEPLMFLAYLMAIYHFLTWCRSGKRSAYWFALVSTILAILAKLPAIQVGLLFAAICFHTFGRNALLRKDVWVFACLSLLIPLAWYWHGHQFWLQYGNSLGMSNEAYSRLSTAGSFGHLAATVLGAVKIELGDIWMPTGAVLGTMGLFWIIREKERWPLGYWFLTLVMYYLVTGRTTGEDWANYYHIVSVPVASLFIGAGLVESVSLAGPLPDWKLRSASLALMGFGLCAIARKGLFSSINPQAALWIAGGGSLGLGFLTLVIGLTRQSSMPVTRLGGPFLALTTLLGLYGITIASEFRQTMKEVRRWGKPDFVQEQYECANAFRKKMVERSLIISSGGPGFDEYGIARAYNAPYMFFWTNSMGFSLSDEDQSIEKLEEFTRRGARYFIALRESIDKNPSFEQAVRQRYTELASCPRAILFQLTPSVGQALQPDIGLDR